LHVKLLVSKLAQSSQFARRGSCEGGLAIQKQPSDPRTGARGSQVGAPILSLGSAEEGRHVVRVRNALKEP
jgi:hypothetical protein